MAAAAAMPAQDPALERVFRGHRGAVTSVAFCGPSLKQARVVGCAAAVARASPATCLPRATQRSALPPVVQAVSGSVEGDLMVWNFAPKMRAFRYLGHGGAVTSVAYDATHHLVASTSADKTVRLWRPTAEGRSTVLKAHTAAVRACAFSRDGAMLATCSDDKTVKAGAQGCCCCEAWVHSWLRLHARACRPRVCMCLLPITMPTGALHRPCRSGPRRSSASCAA